jgi:signal transduction histidine kinase
VTLHYIPDRDEQGHVRGLVALVQDITERKQTEEAIQQAVRLRDEFLSVASHELKTPLTSLSLRLQLLAREAQSQPASPFVTRVGTQVEAGRKQVQRLADLVGDLLDVARISSGKMQLHWEPVDFAAVVREVVARMEPQAAKAEAPLTVEVPEALEGTSDRMRLEQVAENLLTNAIKYGAGQPILVRMEATSERVTLTVRDRGIGIAPEHQARIFERFERAVSDRNYGGLGLGLYITRTLVQAMGGDIGVQSAPGQGATFTVNLPRAPEPPAS